MFRRSRFSVRPNVSTAGRTAATPQEAPPGNQEASETPKDISESGPSAAVSDKSVVTPLEKPAAPGDCNDQNGEGTSSSAAVQRRKRFSIKPKVAPGRPSTLARKSPVKAAPEKPVDAPGSDYDKPTTSSQCGAAGRPQGLQSPRRRRPPDESKQPKLPPKPTLTSSDSFVPPADASARQPGEDGEELESTSQVKEVPSRPSDKVPPSLPDKEAIAISEKARTLVSCKREVSLSPPAFSLSRLLNDPSDLQRLAKARKLRELLKQELHKERKSKKAKARVKEYSLDPAKMTMRDLIRYLPVSNPMTSSLEDFAQENETVVPPSPGRDESPERAQEPEVVPKVASSGEDAGEEEEAEEEQDEALMVPQVKVAEDGSLILDEESLTVEVQRAKGPNLVQDRDPIFERGSTTTYSSFRKGTYSKPWSSEETDMFFLAISMVGTDFSMICQLFPHRARSEIKNKFKKEERINSWRIDKAFRERRKLDIEYFSKLLEKILEVQKTRKKLKSLAEKNPPKKRKRKAKGKKAERKLSDVEEEDEEDEEEIPDLEEMEGEKENEDLCNEGGAPVSKPKRKGKRKNGQGALTKEPNGKKNKTGEKHNEQDEACIPEDAEAALPEDRTNPDMSEKTENGNENAAKDTVIKPAKLSRGRAQKPPLPLGRKWVKKLPPPSTKAKGTPSDEGDKSESDGASNEQENKDASPSKQDNISSEEEDATVQPPRPTRYGRVPKPTKPLTYSAKEDASETSPASPAGSSASAARPKPKCTAKRGRSSKAPAAPEPKKPKLVTLRASQSDYSDDENDKQWEGEEMGEGPLSACGSSKDSSAPVFVPASLRSPQPVNSEVETSMEEFDILASMSDVLNISQDASCERAQNETDTAEACEHQLDLLVDVIDFLSSEHTEVSEDQSYNEAAQTLLTIGNLAHLSQPAQSQIPTQDYITGMTSLSVNEIPKDLVEETGSKSATQEENSTTPLMSASLGHEITGTSEPVVTVELESSTTDSSDVPLICKTSDQVAGSDLDPTIQLQSSTENSKTNSVQPRRGRLSRVKPKPNLGQASRTAQSKSQSEAPTAEAAKESHTAAPDLSQATDTPPAAEEISEITDYLSKDDISCTELKVTEEERSVDREKSSAPSDQSCSKSQGHCYSSSQFEPSLEQLKTDEKVMSHVGTTETSCNDLLALESTVPELKAGQETDIDSSPVQVSSARPSFSLCVSSVDDVPVRHTEQSEDASTQQARRSRFQRVKPKPNLVQTSKTIHSEPETTKDNLEKDSNPIPNTKLHEQTTLEVGADSVCTSSPASDLIPSLNVGYNVAPTEELSTSEEKRAEVVVQVELGRVTSDQSASENQDFSEVWFEPSREQVTRDTRPTSESTEEKLISHVGTPERSSSNLLTSDSSAVTEHVGQESNSNLPALCDTAAEQSSFSQTEESEVSSTCQGRRGRKQKVKPNLPQTSRDVRPKPQATKDPVTHTQPVEKPLSITTVPEAMDTTVVEGETQPTGNTPPVSTASVAEPSPEELPSTKDQKTDVESTQDSNGSEQNLLVPQRRRCFAKVIPKPNLVTSTRTTQTKLQSNDISEPSEQCHMDTSSSVTLELSESRNAQTGLKHSERDSRRPTSAYCSPHTELLCPTKLQHAETEKSLDPTKGTSSDGVVIATRPVSENQSMLTDSVLENESSKKCSVEGETAGENTPHNDRVEAGPASRWDCKQSTSIRTTETNVQLADDPTAILGVQSLDDGSTESKVLPANTQPTADPTESTQQPRSQDETEEQSQDAVQQCSESTHTVDQSTDSNHPAQTDSSKSARKSPQIRRGRLVKPTPNLRPSSQPAQSRRIRSTIQKQAGADSSTCSENKDVSVSHKHEPVLEPDIEGPAEGAVKQRSNQSTSLNEAGSSQPCLTQVTELTQRDFPSNVAGSSLGNVTQVPDNSTQEASTSCTGGTQRLPSLSIFPNTLPGQMLSDPDEPFFILSLTEIPACSSGEAVDGACEPLPYLPEADASVEQHSVPGECLAAVGEEPLVNVTVSMEDSGDTGIIGVKDTEPAPAALRCSIMESPEDPRESTTVQTSKLPETVENETEIPPSKQRLMGSGRRAKLQVKPNTTTKKQASKTLAAKESVSLQINTTEDLELPGPSVQPKSLDEVVTELQTQSRRASHRNRNPKGSLSVPSGTNNTDPVSNSPAGKAPSKHPKVKTPRAAGKPSAPAPVASASHDAAPAPSPTQPPEETHSAFPTTPPTQTVVHVQQTAEHIPLCSGPNPRASPYAAEVSAFQQSEGVESMSIEDEPTSVCQYFLSDIFTEVEEG